jgi:hypothetical protein
MDPACAAGEIHVVDGVPRFQPGLDRQRPDADVPARCPAWPTLPELREWIVMRSTGQACVWRAAQRFGARRSVLAAGVRLRVATCARAA